MAGFSFAPVPEEREAYERRLRELRVWWVSFDEPVGRVFCDRPHVSAVLCADYGITWVGIDTRHWPRVTDTTDPDTQCVEFGVPIDSMAVEHGHMRGWMEVVRANGLHGTYREAGTDREYRF